MASRNQYDVGQGLSFTLLQHRADIAGEARWVGAPSGLANQNRTPEEVSCRS